jgi:thiol-disulfide isomerase/thioredoxin
MPWLAVGGVVVVVGLFVVMFLTKGDDTERGNAGTGSLGKLTSVPAATLEAVGVPAEPSNVNLLPSGTPAVEQDGKPVVLYVGAEYCPFCAVERWAMVVALSRFGTFTGLESTTSAPPPETLPNTPTVTFAGATYTSDVITFSSAETETRDFTPLQSLTGTQQQLVDTYNVKAVTGSNGGIPFAMVGNLYAWAGSQYDPAVLDGKNFDEIATALQDPTTEVAKQIGGAANYITAMICQLTGGQPSDVCSSAVIQQAQAALPTS